MTHIDRRKFLGASLLASTAVAGPTTLLQFLASPDAATRVMTILKESAGINDSHRPVVEAFTKSLLTAATHKESGAAFQAKLLGTGAPGELEHYVVQEFIITTTFLEYGKDPSAKIVMLPYDQKPVSRQALV